MMQHSSAMQRRTLLKLGAASAVLLAVAGGGVALWQPGLQAGRLAPGAREAMAALCRAVLDGSLDTDPARQAQQLAQQLDRLDAFAAGLPPHAQRELSQLLGLLALTPGRQWLAGVSTGWAQASIDEMGAGLQAMRTSSLSLRQQAYHALRDMINGTFYAEPANWPLMGYPGPGDL